MKNKEEKKMAKFNLNNRVARIDRTDMDISVVNFLERKKEVKFTEEEIFQQIKEPHNAELDELTYKNESDFGFLSNFTIDDIRLGLFYGIIEKMVKFELDKNLDKTVFYFSYKC